MKCDELESFESERIYWAVEQVEKETGDIDDLNLDDNLFYLKSEADKYIALLKDKANYNECEYKLKSEELANTCRFYEDELRHQKYKRCLAMASKCRLRARWFGDNAFYKKEQWALQWHRLWLELAEKFKEAK